MSNSCSLTKIDQGWAGLKEKPIWAPERSAWREMASGAAIRAASAAGVVLYELFGSRAHGLLANIAYHRIAPRLSRSARPHPKRRSRAVSRAAYGPAEARVQLLAAQQSSGMPQPRATGSAADCGPDVRRRICHSPRVRLARVAGVESAGDDLSHHRLSRQRSRRFPGTSGPTGTATGCRRKPIGRSAWPSAGRWLRTGVWRWAPIRPRTRISAAVRRSF